MNTRLVDSGQLSYTQAPIEQPAVIWLQAERELVLFRRAQAGDEIDPG